MRERFWSLCQWTQAPGHIGPPAVFLSGFLAREARWAGDQCPSWVGPGRAEGRGWAVRVPTLSPGLLGEETP